MADYFSNSNPNNDSSRPTTAASRRTPSPGLGPSNAPGAFPTTPGSVAGGLRPPINHPGLGSRNSSIRLRRIPSQQLTSTYSARRKPVPADDGVEEKDFAEGRKRSFSAPQRPTFDVLQSEEVARQRTAEQVPGAMPSIQENVATKPEQSEAAAAEQTQTEKAPTRRNSILPAFLRPGSAKPRPQTASSQQAMADQPAVPGSFPTEYDSNVVDLLDLIDPEVSTLSTLTNVQNSLFVPSLGRFLNRRPMYDISPRVSDESTEADSSESESDEAAQKEEADKVSIRPPPSPGADGIRQTTRLQRTESIKSVLDETHYAVLPHGVSLEGWSEDDKRALDDHVRHFLHSKRSKFKRGLKGFFKYMSKPLGFLVTFYAFSITIFGLVWVLMLIGWISGGNSERHRYLINVVDNVLVALFAVVGDGLAPFRAYDTYHMSWIAHYTFKSWKLRRKRGLPKLRNHNDLPEALETDGDLEAAGKDEFSVLSAQQQLRLEHHQAKYQRSHTFYKPHETTTHHAFPVKLLVVIQTLLDMHSCLQISLGAVTWGIDYRHRSQIPTTVILCCSICSNILAGVLISVGDRRTRKQDVIEQMFRQTLTHEAMKKVRKHKKERRKELEAEAALRGTARAEEAAEAEERIAHTLEESKKQLPESP